MNRRDVVCALPAFGIGLAGMQAPPIQVSPVMALFGEWKRIFQVIDLTETEREYDALYARLVALENRIIKLPSTSAHDLAAKLVVWTNFGTNAFCSEAATDIWGEITTLTA